MDFISKTIIGLSVRTWFCILILIGSFLTVYGWLHNMKSGGYVLVIVIGLIISVISIFIAAIPSPEKK